MKIHVQAPLKSYEILLAERAASTKPTVQTRIIPRYPQADIKPPMRATDTACESIIKMLLMPKATPLLCGSTSLASVAELSE